jgi:hypothetical protein
MTMKVDSATRDAVLAITDRVLLERWTNTYPRLASQIYCQKETAPYTDGAYLQEMNNGEFRAHEEVGLHDGLLKRLQAMAGHNTPQMTTCYLQEIQHLTQDEEERIKLSALAGDDDES